ncbi:MAG: hypothetical protein OEY19_07880 [Gammaproteobacteria bacterium]|nr:hypothetical protein [Gammaproteobacteria bacterium]MDH5629712.1 hypothetical protein [Gammaproteobacteria bacterium]
MKFIKLAGFSVLLLLNVSTLELVNASEGNFMYRWKGPNGELNYTERPPAKGIPYERVRLGKKDIGSAESPSQNNETTVQNENPPGTNIEDDGYSNWQKENCKLAKQNLDILLNAARIAQDDGQGGTRLMSDEEKQENIKKMTEQKDKYCI